VFQYNIPKKKDPQEDVPQEEPNPLMRKKKTPEELAREAEAEEEDEFTSKTGSGSTPQNIPSQPVAGESPGAGRASSGSHG
jgi:complexin-1/2